MHIQLSSLHADLYYSSNSKNNIELLAVHQRGYQILANLVTRGARGRPWLFVIRGSERSERNESKEGEVWAVSGSWWKW
jgi:hypothetical protein